MAGLSLGLVMQTQADHPAGTLFETAGYVRDDFSNAVVGVNVTGDNFIGDYFYSTTDSNGFYRVNFPYEGNYRIVVDCAQLTTLGYGCVSEIVVAQEADPIFHDFTVSSLNATLQITNTTLPTGNVGMAYSAQLAATGGQPPYTWQLASTSPSLPAGLSLGSNGLIAGTPTAFSAANIKVEVSSASSAGTNKTFLLVVNPRPLLTAVSWVTNRFTLRLAGAPHQNYTLQTTTNLAAGNWTSLFVTNNPDTGTFLVRDANATNTEQHYRVLIGP